MNSNSKPQPSLKARALRWLSAREHTCAELERRLRPHAADESELQSLLQELQDKGFLSDARATEALLHRRQALLGTARLQQELRQRGVPPAHCEQAVQALRATELERAQAVWARKFGAAPRDRAEAARQMRFLSSRGFAPEAIRRVVPAIEAMGLEAEGEAE
ncbi:MAG: recombination regulator RecX [Rhodoferax sp.]